MKDDKLDLIIAKLRAEYAAQLPGSVAQMDELWQRLLAAEVPATGLAELIRMAHSIAGSGTTFGLPDASRAAREVESFLERFAADSRLPEPAEQETVATLLAALKLAVVQN